MTEKKPGIGETNGRGTTGMNLTECLNCGKKLDAVSSADGRVVTPKPGDPVACIRCGAVMTYEAGSLRPFTEEEAGAILADEGYVEVLRRLVGTIRIMQAEKN